MIFFKVVRMLNTKEKNIKDIMVLLIHSDIPMTIEQLAATIEVSAKTVRNYLNEISEKFRFFGIELIKKPNIGTFIEATPDQRSKLKKNLFLDDINPYSSEYRQKYIVKILLKNRYTYTIQLLADDLYCSKSTIVKDLLPVQEWLSSHDLCLKRKPNQGLWIEGSERAVRDAMMTLFAKASARKEENHDLNFEMIEQLDYRVDLHNYKKIKHFFPKLEFFAIQKIIQDSEEKLGSYFTDQAFINLIAHIAITIERVKVDKNIEIKNDYYDFVKENKEYPIAKWVVNELRKCCKLEIPEEESAYICLHMLGAKIQESVNKDIHYNELIQSPTEPYLDIAKEIIHLTSDIIGADLSNDEFLLASLVLHLRPTIIRLKYGLNLHNPLLQRIKKEFVNVFAAVWISNTIFEKRLGVSINEDEVAYITLHIAAALERLQHKIKTIVVCSSGIGTSQLVANRLRKALPILDIIDVVPLRKLSQNLLLENNLIVSTVPINLNSPKIVYVSTFIDEKDIALIQRSFVKSKGPLPTESLPISNDNSGKQQIIESDYCFFDTGDQPYFEIIKKHVKIMEKAGLVHPRFYENIIAREQKSSTVIGKGIAIPHAKEDYVLKPKIAFIKLAKPIIWDKQKVDLIFILALKFADIKNTRHFFKNFYALLDNEEIMNRLRTAKNKSDIIALFDRI